MVRLMLTLTPVVCVLAAIAFSKTFDIYLKDDAKKTVQPEIEDKEKNDKYYDKVKKIMRKCCSWIWNVIGWIFEVRAWCLSAVLNPCVCLLDISENCGSVCLWLKNDKSSRTLQHFYVNKILIWLYFHSLKKKYNLLRPKNITRLPAWNWHFYRQAELSIKQKTCSIKTNLQSDCHYPS